MTLEVSFMFLGNIYSTSITYDRHLWSSLMIVTYDCHSDDSRDVIYVPKEPLQYKHHLSLITYKHQKWSSIMIITDDHHLWLSMTIITSDRNLQLSLTIVTHDHHLQSALTIITDNHHWQSSLTIVTDNHHWQSSLTIVTYDRKNIFIVRNKKVSKHFLPSRRPSVAKFRRRRRRKHKKRRNFSFFFLNLDPSRRLPNLNWRRCFDVFGQNKHLESILYDNNFRIDYQYSLQRNILYFISKLKGLCFHSLGNLFVIKLKPQALLF